MASIERQANGRKSIRVVCADRKRRTIRLGKMDIRTAEKIRTQIEALNVAKCLGEPIPVASANWLATVGDLLHERLARAGLCEPRNAATLKAWTDHYIKGRASKPRTLSKLKNVAASLISRFGADCRLGEITAFNAEEWRNWLTREGNRRGCKPKETGQPMAEDTVRKHCSVASQFFEAAIEGGLLTKNPFAKIPKSSQGNVSRQFFVSQAVAEKCIEEAPSVDWRTIIALARYGGVRCPSEIAGLKWSDVNLPAGVMTIHSPKTAHHKSKGIRQTPIFPELRPYLDAAWDAAKDGAVYVVPSVKSGDKNLGTQFARMVKRAGFVPWPRLFQNLRASRQTELLAEYPAKDVTTWLGNTQAVAIKHYAMAQDSVFERAAKQGAGTRPAKAGHKMGQQTKETDRTGTQKTQQNAGDSYKRECYGANESTPSRTRTIAKR